jgi:acyl-CoA thioesterase FadM
MPRRVTFEVPVDSSLFTPLQVQPRALLALMMSGWAHWVRAHLASFPSLIRDHRVGVVVLGAHLEYVAPLHFQDADAIEMTVTLGTRRGGAQLLIEHEHRAAGRLFARSYVPLRTVILDEGGALGATPGVLPPHLLAKFEPDEIGGDPPPRWVSGLVAQAEAGTLLAEGRMPFMFHRHLCEVADQWSFIEVPVLAGAGRERLALVEGARQASLRLGLARPVRQIDVEYSRPLFAFNEGELETRAWEQPSGLAFVHRLMQGAQVHATVIEQF